MDPKHSVIQGLLCTWTLGRQEGESQNILVSPGFFSTSAESNCWSKLFDKTATKVLQEY